MPSILIAGGLGR